MERLDDEAIQVDGTIYYEGDNMEAVYVAQPLNDGVDEYEYADQSLEQDQWEVANENAPVNQGDEDTVQVINKLKRSNVCPLISKSGSKKKNCIYSRIKYSFTRTKMANCISKMIAVSYNRFI